MIVERYYCGVSIAKMEAEETEAALHNCFEDTRWELFDKGDTEQYTFTILDDCKFRVESAT